MYPEPILSWLLVCRSRDLRRGEVRSLAALGRSIVLFRTAGGTAHALSASCAHMGTDLSLGRVVADCLQCPLHRWEFDGEGVCLRRPQARTVPPDGRQFAFPLVERYGALFLYPGPAPAFPVPDLSRPDDAWEFTVGPPVRLRCSWKAIGANVFDMEHLESVHDRALVGAPVVEQPSPHCLRLAYSTRVTGQGVADRAIAAVNRGCVRADIACWGGTLLVAENRTQRVGTVLVLGVVPAPEGVQVTPVFAVPRGRFRLFDRVRAALARTLVTTFLDRDVRIMDGMQFRHSEGLPPAAPLARYLSFVEALPGCPATPTT